MTAPICLEKSANLLKCCTMKKVKLYHKQLSVFYRNEYTRVCVFGVCKACLTPFILIHLQFLPPPIWHGFLFASHHVDQLLFVNFSIFFLNFKG